MVAQWVANSVPAGTPSRAGKGETNLRRPATTVKGGLEGCGLEGCRKMLQAVGEGRVLRPDEPGEPEPLRATRWDSPPSFRFRPHNTHGYRPPGPRRTGLPHTGVRGRFELRLCVDH